MPGLPWFLAACVMGGDSRLLPKPYLVDVPSYLSGYIAAKATLFKSIPQRAVVPASALRTARMVSAGQTKPSSVKLLPICQRQRQRRMKIAAVAQLSECRSSALERSAVSCAAREGFV